MKERRVTKKLYMILASFSEHVHKWIYDMSENHFPTWGVCVTFGQYTPVQFSVIVRISHQPKVEKI